MKLLNGLFDMLASKSDADASNLIEGLAKEMKEKMEQVPAAKKGQAFGAKTIDLSSTETVKAKNTVSPDYKQLEVGVHPYVSPKGAPSGKSWGPTMPKEPNQFNSHKPYDQYFREIFQVAFPEYEITEESGMYSRPATVFTFLKDGKRALVVEVISEGTDVYKRRNECRQTGTPYLRYYHDHDGWWNTIDYVVDRTKRALGG